MFFLSERHFPSLSYYKHLCVTRDLIYICETELEDTLWMKKNRNKMLVDGFYDTPITTKMKDGAKEVYDTPLVM